MTNQPLPETPVSPFHGSQCARPDFLRGYLRGNRGAVASEYSFPFHCNGKKHIAVVQGSPDLMIANRLGQRKTRRNSSPNWRNSGVHAMLAEYGTTDFPQRISDYLHQHLFFN